MAALDIVSPGGRGALTVPGDPERALAGALRTALLLLVAAVGGATAWAFLAMLDGAALGAGTVTVQGNRKTVQHLEGGIVAELTVREGDRVQAGQVLLRLEGAQSRAAFEELAGQYWTAVARLSRLRAEQAGERSLILPDELLARAAELPAAARAVEAQQALFSARWQSHDGELAVLRGQIQEARQEIASFRIHERTAAEKIGYTEQELAGVLDLYHKGLERTPRLMAVRRALADSLGQRDEARAQIGRTEQTMAVLERQVQARERTRAAEIAAEIEATQSVLADVSARIGAARDALARTELRAPIGGKVVGLTVFTVGGVVRPGDAILEIVPANEELTVEARISPADIDVVREGLPAQVRLTAFNMRRTPTVDGTVTRVSADRFSDPNTGEAFFKAIVRPDPEALRRLGVPALHPGMPAEVMIRTGERRAIDYLLAPLLDSLSRSLTEQ